ncbi:UNKNOWN [Stylonychia lemnae]|uniref:Uncharacterized protein n=1 Tax=Stylonychia lemnae TaxID=5949 RepID=A0A078AH09_STYLE|nr:UNKNOWN [Stylonychia lemnae]|eukprot:CDW81560.1 UNKNOWN [Stylonychia lemnae]
MGLYSVYGIKNVLEIVNPVQVQNLMRNIRPYIQDKSESMGDVKYDIYNAVAGGYLFRSKCFEVPEAATNPLKIYAIFQASVMVKQSAFNFFTDFVYDDVLSMSQVDQEFNLFKAFVVEGKDPMSKENTKKYFSLEEVINGRNTFYAEIKEAVDKKFKIALKIWLRIRNLDKANQSSKVSSQPPGTAYQGIGTAQNLVVSDDDYVYVKTEKIYVLHLVERRQMENIVYTSYSHSPMSALLEGVFQSREAAQQYASFYISKDQNPAEKSRLQIYLEDKYFQIFKKYQKNIMSHALYETLMIVLLEKDEVRKQIVDGVMVLLNLSSCKLFGLTSITQVLQKLLQAFYDYKFPQFRKSLENQFYTFYSRLQEIMATGFCAEIIVFRKYLDILIDSISGQGHQELEIDNSTMETFRNIEAILKCVSSSELTNVSQTYHIAKMTINMVVNKFGSQLNSNFISQEKYQQNKAFDKAAKLSQEKSKNKQSKLYPSKDEDIHIYMQYTVDTFVYESIYYILRDQFFYEQFPNALAIASMRIQAHLMRFDLYGGIPDEYIRRQELQKPFQNAQPPMTLYILGNSEMRDKDLPFPISDFFTLSVTSPNDISIFKKFLNNYEIAKLNIGDMFEGGYLKILTSITGYSIFNKYARLNKKSSFWTMMYDIIMTGQSFDAAIPSYIALILRYALFLYKQTDAVVLGFYTDDDIDNAAVTIFQIKGDADLKEASRKMYEFVKGRIRIYMRMLLPLETDFKKVHVYFNLHFKNDSTNQAYSSLYHVNSIHDVAKVFFKIEDFTDWDIVQKSHPYFSPTEHLIEEYKTAYLDFRFLDAFKCLIILKIMDEKEEHYFHFMRVLYSQAETFNILVHDIQIMRDIVKDIYRADIHKLQVKKVGPINLLNYYLQIRETISQEIKNSHLTIIDGYQTRIINLMQDLELYIVIIKTPSTLPHKVIKTLETIQRKFKQIELILKVISNCQMLYASEYMKSTFNINAFDDPLTIE